MLHTEPPRIIQFVELGFGDARRMDLLKCLVVRPAQRA
jgi:hypothetical protein